MGFRNAERIYPLATMIALAALNARSPRFALAQIPEAPGTFTNSGGGARIQQGGPTDLGRRKKGAQPAFGEATPSARDTIDEMEKARARASGTSMPTPTPR